MNRLTLLAASVAILVIAVSGCAPAETAAPTPLPPTHTTVPQLETPILSDTTAPPEVATEPVDTAPPLQASPLELSSAAFEHKGPIPVRHACHGENLSPPLAWNQPPPGTVSYALIMDDPDAVPVAGFVWDHWLLFNLPAQVTSLAEGVPQEGELADGSRQGENSSNRLGYAGPCPPGGQTHGYVFRLYALDTTLDLPAGASKEEILQAMEGHILAQAELVGMYTAP